MTKPRSAYAAKTDVDVDRSITQIEKHLQRFGCSAFQRGWMDGERRREIVSFESSGRRLRFELSIPNPDEFRYTPAQLRRTDNAMMAAFEQERRRLWRVLEIAIRAKLASVESGVVTFEDEFLAYTVMPNNQTVGQWVKRQADRFLADGLMPPLLPGGDE